MSIQMSFGFGFSYLIFAATLIGGFLLVRHWYAKDRSCAMALLLVMLVLILIFGIFAIRSNAMNVNWTFGGQMLLLVLFVLPALLVVASSKVHGYEKLGWSLVSLFLSWVGFMVFLITHGSRFPTTRQG